ncbi:MAG TPA: 1-deoxy-D-xylulose-5-phosphate reductoisomerase, partial [Brevundimonas sp.]|nr:1-deoxy-D-xylulose-5-phosphate reductoisomerase [Brevundimonas sp.]
MMHRRISVLGATGSVGSSTLALMDEAERAGTARFTVAALTGGRNIERLAEAARRWRPELVVTVWPELKTDLEHALAGTGIAVAAGEAALIEAALQPADWIMAAIVGVAGLKSTW